jgi:hypothetical protein
MFTPSMPHMHFFHFCETCNLDSNSSTKILGTIVVFYSFWRATLALVLEYHEEIQWMKKKLEGGQKLPNLCVVDIFNTQQNNFLVFQF